MVAMEPAVYRREHEPCRHLFEGGGPVAMEPAVYRREHGAPFYLAKQYA